MYSFFLSVLIPTAQEEEKIAIKLQVEQQLQQYSNSNNNNKLSQSLHSPKFLNANSELDIVHIALSSDDDIESETVFYSEVLQQSNHSVMETTK